MNEVQGTNELPAGWVWTSIEDVCGLINGRAFKPSEWSSEGLPIIRIQNLNNPDAEFNYCNFEVDERYLVDKGQLLFAWSGTPGTSFGAHIWKGERAYLNQHIFKIELDENYLNKSYFMYLINRNVFEYIQKAHGTAGLAHITKKKFETSLIPLPPFPEQHRIVAKIEELFTQLDAGVSALEKSQAQLKRYRQSVLKAAVEGKLTEEWRRSHPNVEPASVLLERIEREREKSGKGRRKNLRPLDTADLSVLPDGWEWEKISQVGDVRLGRQRSPRNHTGDYMRPYLRVSNVFEDRIDTSDILWMNFTPDEFDTYQLRYGDVLLNEGQSLELVGRPAIYRDEVPGSCFQNTLVRFRPYDALTSEYALCVFRAYFHNGRFQKIAKWTTTMAHLGAGRFSEIEFPLPPLIEQYEIVSEIERSFSVADNTDATIMHNLKRASRLRQSILKKAFRGELIPQDPNDEPASVLLERLKAERFQSRPANNRAKRGRGRPRKNAAVQMELI